MPSWGAPAKGANISSPNPPTQSTQSQSVPASDSQGQNRNRQQRHSPYPNIPSQRQGEYTNSRGQFTTPEQTQNTGNGSGSNFSSDNPFMNQTRFSVDNPFHHSSDSAMSSENPYDHRDMSSPIHHRAPRPSFQPSPLIQTPVGRGHQPRFSPRTPSSMKYPSSRFQSPSPRYQTPPNRFQSGYHRGFSPAKRGFGNRNGSFSNPGGSDDIQQYVNTSMLEDPWRDLPATPLLQTY